MPTNTLAPTGLKPVRNLLTNSPTFQASFRNILGTYATTIGFGDVVAIGPSGTTEGYVILAPDGAASVLGVFGGCLPFYSSTISRTVNQNGWVSTTGAPTSVQCLVYDDPFLVFQAQMDGGPFTQSMVGQNIDWTAATNGAPGSGPAYISTLSLDADSIGPENTKPFKILGVAPTITGGPQDPANTNPIIEVRLNTAQLLSSSGV